MKKEPIGDLQLLFLRLIAEETPEATAALFRLRDAGQWMAKYRVSADWLETFLNAVLKEWQTYIDEIVADAERWESRGEPTVAEKAFMEIHLKRVARRKPKEQRSAQAQAWLRTLQNYAGKQLEFRILSKVFPDLITYLDPTIDKRAGETHCRWLVDKVFGGKSDSEIAKGTRGKDRVEGGKRRRAFAVEIIAITPSLACVIGRF
jgi:hypothetical protein